MTQLISRQKWEIFAFAGLAGLSILAAIPASATPTYYVGIDSTASTFTALTYNAKTSTTAPGTLTALNAYNNAISAGTLQQYDFANQPNNTVATGESVLATGVSSPTSPSNQETITFSNDAAANIFSAPIASLSGGSALGGTAENLGFSTQGTNGKYLFVQGNTTPNNLVTFTFANPVTSFGLFITGLGNSGAGYPVTISFNDGTAESYTVNGSATSKYAYGTSTATFNNTPVSTGGAEFFGFTDTSTFTSVQFSENNGASDRYSIDNFDYTNVTPEPSPVAIFGIGALTLAGLLIGKRRRAVSIV